MWRKCSSCKQPIQLSAKYYVCSVSTCNGLRTGYVFCSIGCFERHLPGAKHRQAGAIEKVAPRVAEESVSVEENNVERAPARIIIKNPSTAQTSVQSSSQEVLIIASRLKDYIQNKSQFNTSSQVMDVLSDHVRRLCDRAIDNARAEGRKTVLDRDFDFLKDF